MPHARDRSCGADLRGADFDVEECLVIVNPSSVRTKRNPARMSVRCEAMLSRAVSAITLDTPQPAAMASRATTASAA